MFTPEKTLRGRGIDAWLSALLSSGEMSSRDVYANAKEAGITSVSLNRAKKRVGVRSVKREFGGGGWFWSLPKEDGDGS